MYSFLTRSKLFSSFLKCCKSEEKSISFISNTCEKRLRLHTSQVALQDGFCNMKRLGEFPLDGMLVHRRVTDNIKFAGTHYLHTWVERGTARIKCLAQEHNTVTPAGTPTRTARSGDERTNHEATTPLPILEKRS